MSLVLLERPEDHIALLRMNRPDAMNALSTAVREELSDHFEALSLDDNIRAIIITGNEKVFIAGADLKEMASRGTIDWSLFDARRMNRAISACPKPIISAINGFALGGGCEIAMSTTSYRRRRCTIGSAGNPGRDHSWRRWHQRLDRTVGKYRANMMLLTADFVSAAEALEMGLVSEVVPDEEVETRAVEVARKITRMPPLSVKLTKEVVNAGMDASLETGLLLERKAFEILFSSEDQRGNAGLY